MKKATILINKATREALIDGREKWLHAGETGDFSNVGDGHQCGLCRLYVRRSNSCIGCPVELVSGDWHCRNTPYRDWNVAWEYDEDSRPHASRMGRYLDRILKRSEVVPGIRGARYKAVD